MASLDVMRQLYLFTTPDESENKAATFQKSILYGYRVLSVRKCENELSWWLNTLTSGKRLMRDVRHWAKYRIRYLQVPMHWDNFQQLIRTNTLTRVRFEIPQFAGRRTKVRSLRIDPAWFFSSTDLVRNVLPIKSYAIIPLLAYDLHRSSSLHAIAWSKMKDERSSFVGRSREYYGLWELKSEAWLVCRHITHASAHYRIANFSSSFVRLRDHRQIECYAAHEHRLDFLTYETSNKASSNRTNARISSATICDDPSISPSRFDLYLFFSRALNCYLHFHHTVNDSIDWTEYQDS